MVKRIAITLALVGTIAFAGVALAASEFTGKFRKGGTVSFRLTEPTGEEQRKVKRWKWNNLKIRCRNGRHRHDGKFKGVKLPVDPKDRTFSFRGENDYGGKAILRGSFTDETFTRATGTLKIRGRTYLGRKCRGKSSWRAHGPPPPTVE